MYDIEKELQYLRSRGIVSDQDSLENIQPNVYSFRGWAEFFWRRRHQHAKREDPEIPFVIRLNPQYVLEVGSGYGRFTRKLAKAFKAKGLNPQITGVEVNPTFKDYVKQYQEQYPTVKDYNFVYDSIFKAKNHFKQQSFDVIVCPMHIIPFFTLQSIKQLLPVIRYLLTDDGKCIFSYHKLADTPVKLEEALQKDKFDKQYNGELLVELDKPPLAATYYDFPPKQQSYGFKRVSYSVFYQLNQDFIVESKYIIRNESDYLLSNYFDNLFKDYGFSIDYINEDSFSRIFCISKTK